jgi:hypothetical protein
MPIAFGKRGYFSHPPVRLVPVEDHFVIIEAHVPSFYNEQNFPNEPSAREILSKLQAQ